MRVYLCWPAGDLKCSPPCDSFEVKDNDGRSWSCTPMRLDGGGLFDVADSVDLARMAVEGGADLVIVHVANRNELADRLAHGVRFVGFSFPVESRESREEPALLCPLPSDN
jgi:hypothetical protein